MKNIQKICGLFPRLLCTAYSFLYARYRAVMCILGLDITTELAYIMYVLSAVNRRLLNNILSTRLPFFKSTFQTRDSRLSKFGNNYFVFIQDSVCRKSIVSTFQTVRVCSVKKFYRKHGKMLGKMG